MVDLLKWELTHPVLIVAAAIVWFGGLLVGRISKSS
jgi:hypothetical protein